MEATGAITACDGAVDACVGASSPSGASGAGGDAPATSSQRTTPRAEADGHDDEILGEGEDETVVDDIGERCNENGARAGATSWPGSRAAPSPAPPPEAQFNSNSSSSTCAQGSHVLLEFGLQDGVVTRNSERRLLPHFSSARPSKLVQNSKSSHMLFPQMFTIFLSTQHYEVDFVDFPVKYCSTGTRAGYHGQQFSVPLPCSARHHSSSLAFTSATRCPCKLATSNRGVRHWKCFGFLCRLLQRHSSSSWARAECGGDTRVESRCLLAAVS